MSISYADRGLDVAVDGHTMTLTLNRPERRNAQTPRMWQALAGVGADLPTGVRSVVLRGAGSSFSAGLDLAMLGHDGPDGEPAFQDLLAAHDDDALGERIAGFQEGFTWLRRPGLVTVAAVHGHAIGAGLQLALACDFRVLTPDAMLAMRETTLGLVPDLGGTRALVEAVGYSRALELCLTGRSVDADEALRSGLATIVVPVEQVDATVADLVQAATSADQEAVSATKALLLAAADRSHADQLAAERTAQVRMLRRLGGNPDDAAMGR